MFENARSPRRGTLLVCLAVFGLMTGQQMVNPILAPLARELGFSELALGVVMAVGASGVVVASPAWGRRSTTWGHRRVLLISLTGAMIGLLGFAVVATVGTRGVLAVPLVFGMVLLSRGLVFGLSWAATPVTAQSYVANTTVNEAERVRGMSMIGAAQGLGLAVGPAIGGLLVFAGLLTPAYLAPVILAAIAVLVWWGLPRPRERREPPPSVRVSPFDARMWPFLTAGFGMYLALSVVLMTIGFLVQDRLDLDAEQTGRTTGLVMLAAAGMLIVVQAAVVPRLGWAPVRLLRTGAIVMTVGMVALVFAYDGATIAASLAVLGAGMGFGAPGFMSAPTLLASRDEQGAVAGLMGSANALTFMLGPLLGNGLYQVAPASPYVVCAALLVALTVFVFAHPGARQRKNAALTTSPASTAKPVATASTTSE